MGSVMIGRDVRLQVVQVVANAGNIRIRALGRGGVLCRTFCECHFARAKVGVIAVNALRRRRYVVSVRFVIACFGFTRAVLLNDYLRRLTKDVRRFRVRDVRVEYFNTPRLKVAGAYFYERASLFSNDRVASHDYGHARDFTANVRRDCTCKNVRDELTVILRIYFSAWINLIRAIASSEDGVRITRTGFQDYCRVSVPISATRTRRVLIFRVTTIAPTVRFSYRCIFAQLRVLYSIRLNVIINALTVPSFLAVSPRARDTMRSIRISGRFFVLPINQRERFPPVKACHVELFLCHVSSLSLCGKQVITCQVNSVNVSKNSMSRRLPVKEGQGLFPNERIVTQFVRVRQAFKELLRPVGLPIAVRRRVAKELVTCPEANMQEVTLRLFHVNGKSGHEAPLFFIGNGCPFVLPIVVTPNFGDLDRRFRVQFRSFPLLTCFLHVQFRLMGQLNCGANVQRTRIVAAHCANRRVVPVKRDHSAPLLVKVFFVEIPLSSQALLTSVTTVISSRFNRQASGKMTTIAAEGRVPSLQLFVKFLFEGGCLAAWVRALLVIRSGSILNVSLMTLLQVRLLNAGRSCYQPRDGTCRGRVFGV